MGLGRSCTPKLVLWEFLSNEGQSEGSGGPIWTPGVLQTQTKSSSGQELHVGLWMNLLGALEAEIMNFEGKPCSTTKACQRKFLSSRSCQAWWFLSGPLNTYINGHSWENRATFVWHFQIWDLANIDAWCPSGTNTIQDPTIRVHSIRVLQSGFHNPGSSIQVPQSGFLNPGYSIRVPQSGLLNPVPSIRIPQSGSLNPGPSIRLFKDSIIQP